VLSGCVLHGGRSQRWLKRFLHRGQLDAHFLKHNETQVAWKVWRHGSCTKVPGAASAAAISSWQIAQHSSPLLATSTWLQDRLTRDRSTPHSLV